MVMTIKSHKRFMPELIDLKWRVTPQTIFLLLAKHGRNTPKKNATVVVDSDVEEFATAVN
jgi:hypothetical protein